MLTLKDFSSYRIDHKQSINEICGGGFDTGGGTRTHTQNGSTCTFSYDNDYSTQGDDPNGWTVSYYGIRVGDTDCP